MKKEEAVTAIHLIQAAKLGNAKADSIVRTGIFVYLRTCLFKSYFMIVWLLLLLLLVLQLNLSWKLSLATTEPVFRE